MTRGVRHGARYTRTYSIWCNMKSRCNNPNFKDAIYYSQKGITYDSRWEKFDGFLEDMGECPAGMQIDRIDSNRGYYRENCRWVTTIEQARNSEKPLGTSGIRGVKLHKGSRPHFWSWEVYTDTSQGKRLHLYSGKDFFLACCARKSWENRNASGN